MNLFMHTPREIRFILPSKEQEGDSPAERGYAESNAQELDKGRPKHEPQERDRIPRVESHGVGQRCHGHEKHKDGYERWIIPCPLILCLC